MSEQEKPKERSIYQHGYEDALDRGYNASGKANVDLGEYARGFKDGEASLSHPPASGTEGAEPTAAHVVEARKLWDPFRSVLPFDDCQEKVVVSAIATALASRPPEAGGAMDAMRKCAEALGEYVDRCCTSGCGYCEKARAALASASEIGVKP